MLPESVLERVNRLGTMVWRHKGMDKLRETDDLCKNCSRNQGCAVANQMHTIARLNDISIATTACPEFDLRRSK